MALALNWGMSTAMEARRDDGDTTVDGPLGVERDFDDTSVDIVLPEETEDRYKLVAQLEREREVLRAQLADTARANREAITAREQEAQALREQLSEREDEVAALLSDLAALRDENERDMAAAESHLQTLEAELSDVHETASRYEHQVSQLHIELESTRDMASAARRSIVELRREHAIELEELRTAHAVELEQQRDELEGELVDALSQANKRRQDDLAAADQRAAATLAVQYMALAKIFHG